MTCLTCGANNLYGAETCKGCGHIFEAFPPYIKSNHVCQLQAALRACRDGRLDWETFGEVYGRFAESTMSFQARWDMLAGPPLRERLAESLVEAFGLGVSEIDQGLGKLDEGLALVDQALENGDADMLGQADELFTDFFKICCGGCAVLIEELEKVGPPDSAGMMFDVKDE